MEKSTHGRHGVQYGEAVWFKAGIVETSPNHPEGKKVPAPQSQITPVERESQKQPERSESDSISALAQRNFEDLSAAMSQSQQQGMSR